MKYFTLIFFVVLFSVCGFAQGKVDSLSVLRVNLIDQKSQLEKKIEEVEKEIVSDILKNGYDMIVKTSFKGQTLEMKSKDTTIHLQNGDKIKVLGTESIYYNVRFGENTGLVYIMEPEFPISLLKEPRYRDIGKLNVSGKSSGNSDSKSAIKTSSSSSKSGCSSTQCSGRTQKGTRCRNMTTNCNGRCHLH